VGRSGSLARRQSAPLLGDPLMLLSILRSPHTGNRHREPGARSCRDSAAATWCPSTTSWKRP